MPQLYNFSTDELFRFPQNMTGLEVFTDFRKIKMAYSKIVKKYIQGHQIKWHFICRQFSSLKRVKVFCSVCTFAIAYELQPETGEYRLKKVNGYHVHILNFEKYIFYLGIKNRLTLTFQFYTMGKKNKLISSKHNSFNLIKTLHNIPYIIGAQHKADMMKKYFGISQQEYTRITKIIYNQSNMTFPEMIDSFDNQGISYRYMPTHLNKKQNVRAEQHKRKEQIVDEVNPHLPNILVVITPDMKEQYKKFGQVVGFDLTFSIIQERSASDGEYMVGFFAGNNGIKRIIIYGLVVTNSQSVYAYSYIFCKFFEIMGVIPKVIITDEQKAIYQSLKNLKKEGIFTGTHLFDMFHILRKFRKLRYQGQNFKLLRKLIHSPNKIEYRRIFRKMLSQVGSDQELQLLRTFDLNSHMYCYAQVIPSFVGKGVSNSCNQFFHYIVKVTIPYVTGYMKAVQLVLSLIERRHWMASLPIKTRLQMDKFNMPFMSLYANLISDKAFEYITNEVSKSAKLSILGSNQVSRRNFAISLLDTESYYITDQEQGIFRVFKEKQRNRQKQKWKCSCQHYIKCGHLCSHLAKILLALRCDFFDYIDSRWFIEEQEGQNQFFIQATKIKLKRKYQKILFQLEDKDFQSVQKTAVQRHLKQYCIYNDRPFRQKENSQAEQEEQTKRSQIRSISKELEMLSDEQLEKECQEDDRQLKTGNKAKLQIKKITSQNDRKLMMRNPETCRKSMNQIWFFPSSNPLFQINKNGLKNSNALW